MPNRRRLVQPSAQDGLQSRTAGRRAVGLARPCRSRECHVGQRRPVAQDPDTGERVVTAATFVSRCGDGGRRPLPTTLARTANRLRRVAAGRFRGRAGCAAAATTSARRRTRTTGGPNQRRHASARRQRGQEQGDQEFSGFAAKHREPLNNNIQSNSLWFLPKSQPPPMGRLDVTEGKIGRLGARLTSAIWPGTRRPWPAVPPHNLGSKGTHRAPGRGL